MISFVHYILDWGRQIAGLIFPLFRNAADFSRWGRWAWHTLHFVIIGLILFGLWYLNNHVTAVSDWLFIMLRTHQPTPMVKHFFLPLLFLLLYALAWILRWIWLQLGPDADVDEYPDITAAWADGLARLEAKGVKAADLPLFLVLGRNKAGEEFLFRAGHVPIEVFGPPAGDPPVRLWASRDAIYVTCPGASALGTFAGMLARGPGDDISMGVEAAKKTVGLADDDSLDATVQEINALRALARTRELSPDEKARMRELALMANQRPQRAKAMLKAEDVDLAASRLRYLCNLIGKARRPFCPVNGILALLSWEAIDSDDPAKSTALALRTDIATARAGLRLCCPMLALVCDMEEARGFCEFRSGFNTEQLAARIGQRFPLVPDQPIPEQPLLYDSGASWLGSRLFPGRVYQALQLDVKDTRFASARNLFHLFRAAHERMPRLARLLRSGLPMPTGTSDGLDGPLLFAGCYLAATGREPIDQAFVPGVFERLTENQGVVAWTGAAVVDDVSYARKATIGFAIAAVAVIGLLVASWMLLKGST